VQVDVLRDEYEGRVFEDPLYLMQYTINWEDTNAAAAFQSPENDAFLNAENEGYLKKVPILDYRAYGPAADTGSWQSDLLTR